jgi:hypothetical protein
MAVSGGRHVNEEVTRPSPDRARARRRRNCIRVPGFRGSSGRLNAIDEVLTKAEADMINLGMGTRISFRKPTTLRGRI